MRLVLIKETSREWAINEMVANENMLFYSTRYTSIKTHGSVSCGPRKWGDCKRREYIDRNNKIAIFTHLPLCDSLSKFTVELAYPEGGGGGGGGGF